MTLAPPEPTQDLQLTCVVVEGDGRTRTFHSVHAEAAAQAAFAPGQVVQERYRLERELGRGGMGVVYLARDLRLDRPVALKVILTQGPDGLDDFLHDAFEAEARFGAKLTHPAIATVFDYGFHVGSPFTAFEFIAGEALRDLLDRRGRLPLDEARLIVGALAQALDYAHERRVVHRDLKPENIRATEQGLFKVLDLGLARDFQRTEEWRFCGTPAYASPEQAANLPCDGRSDQYALAVIAYELLTGRRPFESRRWMALLEKHIKEPPPWPRDIQPDLPDAVCSALMRALSKDPNARFSTCTEFAVALGCQLLTASAPAPEILMETDFKRMWGRWKSWDAPFSLYRPRVRPALTPDALWGSYRTELMRWPLGALADVQRHGRKLQLRLAATSGKTKQVFKLPSRQEAREWCERLQALGKAAKPAGADGLGPEPGAALDGPKIEPVVLLKGRPGARFQLLGAVEAKAPKLRRSKAGLVVRGAMMGADAVVDLVEERLAGFHQTTYRASGTAIRAVDHDGRIELKARWFDGQVSGLRLGMMVLATFMLLGGLWNMFMGYFSAGSVRTGVLPHLLKLWLFIVATLFTWLRWPQLARPAAVSFIALAATGIVGQVGVLILVLRIASRGNFQGSFVVLAFQLIGLLASVTFLSFYFFLGRRTWQVHREFRDLVTKEVERSARARWYVGIAALTLSAAYAAGMVRRTAWTSYKSIDTFKDGVPNPFRPYDAGRRSRPSRLAPRGQGSAEPQRRNALRIAERATALQPNATTRKMLADARNNLAWYLAVLAPKAERKPGEAVALARQAVEEGGTDASHWNTPAAAHYAAGNWDECAKALKRSMELTRGGREADWWLMALLQRRRGHVEEAEGWHRRALVAAATRPGPNADCEALRREYDGLAGAP